MMKKIPIIIDCDPGHDDAMAILWALSSDKLCVKAITTVAGNKPIDLVTENVLKVLTKANRCDIPVGIGADRPLVKPLVVGGNVVHGKTGLDGPIMPEVTMKVSDLSAFQLLVKTLEESEEKVTLVPIGPLTNIAILLLARPDLKNKIEKLSIMGGGAYTGNWTPAAEYNIFADPEAARVVFNSELPIIMSGLDVTHKAFVTMEENEKLREQGNVISVFTAELIDFFSTFHLKVEGFAGCTLHDPTAICALIRPDIFIGEWYNVDVECNGELTSGMTVVDKMNYKEKIYGIKTIKNVYVLLDVNRDEYVKEFFSAMKDLKI
jgi:pyrimidine-specific ribonucleoside hydrolase